MVTLKLVLNVIVSVAALIAGGAVVEVSEGQSAAPSGTERHDNWGHGRYGNRPRSIQMECEGSNRSNGGRGGRGGTGHNRLVMSEIA